MLPSSSGSLRYIVLGKSWRPCLKGLALIKSPYQEKGIYGWTLKPSRGLPYHQLKLSSSTFSLPKFWQDSHCSSCNIMLKSSVANEQLIRANQASSLIWGSYSGLFAIPGQHIAASPFPLPLYFLDWWHCEKSSPTANHWSLAWQTLQIAKQCLFNIFWLPIHLDDSLTPCRHALNQGLEALLWHSIPFSIAFTQALACCWFFSCTMVAILCHKFLSDYVWTLWGLLRDLDSLLLKPISHSVNFVTGGVVLLKIQCTSRDIASGCLGSWEMAPN